MTKKPLTLLHIYGGEVKIGGHYRSGLAMAKCLVEDGHRVIVLAPGAAPAMAESFRRAGTEFKLLPEVGRINKLPSRSGWKSVAKIAEDDRVDIVHSMDSINLARGYLAAIKTGKSFVCTEAGANFFSHFPPRKSKVVIFSREQMTIYRDLYKLSERNIRIIRARIDSDLYHSELPPRPFTEKYRLTRNGLTVGMVCRLEARKSHQIEALLDFVKLHRRSDKPVSIYIAGDGNLRAFFQKKAQGIVNSSVKVCFIGPVYEIQEVNWFYNFCDVIMGSGRGIMEAMACGKPVIILGEDGQAELIGSDTIEDAAYYNFSGRHFYAKKNSTTINSVLEATGNNPELLLQSSKFCFDYVKTHLSARVGAEQLVDWYTEKTAKSTAFDFWAWYLEACYWILRAYWKTKFAGYF